jgi:hypothetical protein
VTTLPRGAAFLCSCAKALRYGGAFATIGLEMKDDMEQARESENAQLHHGY